VLLRFHSAGGYDRSAYSEAAGLAAFAGYGRPVAAIADLTFRPPTAEERARIDKLLKDLDDDSYDVREAATAAMRAVGRSPSRRCRRRHRAARRRRADARPRDAAGHPRMSRSAI